jgi:hypothetical protein
MQGGTDRFSKTPATRTFGDHHSNAQHRDLTQIGRALAATEAAGHIPAQLILAGSSFGCNP